MLDFCQTINQPQPCRKRKHSSASHLPLNRLQAIARYIEPFMGFRSTQATMPDTEVARGEPASNGKIGTRTAQNNTDTPMSSRRTHSSVPNSKESAITTTPAMVKMPEPSPTPPATLKERPSIGEYRKLGYSSELRRNVYPGGRTKTEISFSLSGRPLSAQTSSTPTLPSRRVAWTESITRKGSRITKTSKPRLIRVNGKNLSVNETTTTNVILRPKHLYGRSVKPSEFALLFCAAIVAIGALGTYTVASLDSEIQQLRALKQHQKATIGLLQNRLSHVQRVVEEELTGNNSAMSVLVAISNVLSWAAGSVTG